MENRLCCAAKCWIFGCFFFLFSTPSKYFFFCIQTWETMVHLANITSNEPHFLFFQIANPNSRTVVVKLESIIFITWKFFYYLFIDCEMSNYINIFYDIIFLMHEICLPNRYAYDVWNICILFSPILDVKLQFVRFVEIKSAKY